MRLHRFLIDVDLSQKELVLTDEELSNQLRNVLRLVPGDEAVVTDGQGKEAIVKIESLTKKEVVMKVTSVEEPDRESGKNVTLYISMLKRENFELVLQKAVEVGVQRIVPIISARTVKLGFNRERYDRIIKEAVEQSGRVVCPILDDPIDLEQALSSVSKFEAVFFCDGTGEESLESVSMDSLKQIACFIGPEGGWDPREVVQARAAGVKLVNLGVLTLRAETAAIVTAYVLCQSQ